MTNTAGKRISRIPAAPGHIAGVVHLRGRVLPVIDLRKVLGMPSMSEETEVVLQLLRDRERDHVNWLKELRASVDEKRQFMLATDPHKCAFGKWYDRLMADEADLNRLTNGDPALIRLLREFDAPHRRIHAIAQHVEEFVSQGHAEQAHDLIASTQSTQLARMVELFDRTRHSIAELRQSLLIEIEDHGVRTGILVDGADKVADVDEACVEPATGMMECSEYVHGFLVHRDQHNQAPDILLDADALLGALTA